MRLKISAVALIAVLGWQADALAADAKIVNFFKETCGVCHGEKGEGMKGLAPPLKGSEFVKTASAAELGNTITKGRAGDAKKFKDLASPMPPNSMSDSRLAGVIDYLKGDLQK
jgi:mono/diheme cytochrome c family protein